MNHRTPLYILCVLLLTAFFSCVGTAPTKEVRFIDSLNRRAYAYRYKNLDSSYLPAEQAYGQARLYQQGKAEACNNLGFCAFMQMDFERAEKIYKEVYGLTKNELELLIADIGLMKIYQRTGMNKEYYDYRNSAVRRMKRIREDSTVFTDKYEMLRVNFAFTEFFIVSAVYYYYLQQRPEAMASLDKIPQDESLRQIPANTCIFITSKDRLLCATEIRRMSVNSVNSTSSTPLGGWLPGKGISILPETVCRDWPTG